MTRWNGERARYGADRERLVDDRDRMRGLDPRLADRGNRWPMNDRPAYSSNDSGFDDDRGGYYGRDRGAYPDYDRGGDYRGDRDRGGNYRGGGDDDYRGRYGRIERVGERLDETWHRLDDTRDRIHQQREHLRHVRDRVEELGPRDDGRWRDDDDRDRFGNRGFDRDDRGQRDYRDRTYPDVHLERWRGPEEWNMRRGGDWRGPDPHDFDMPPRRRR